MEQISEQKLFRSCEILFGSELTVSRQFLDYLPLGGIMSAYRKRALETHPDRIVGRELHILGRDTEKFHAVRKASETLLSFVLTKKQSKTVTDCNIAGRPERPKAPRQGEGHHCPDGNSTGNGRPVFRQGRIKPFILPDDIQKGTGYADTERYYNGPLPRRRLLFGNFLYYSVLANWRTIARILIWQRGGRPRLGEQGKRFGMWREQDINDILQASEPFHQFGEDVQMLGVLTAHPVRERCSTSGTCKKIRRHNQALHTQLRARKGAGPLRPGRKVTGDRKEERQ